MADKEWRHIDGLYFVPRSTQKQQEQQSAPAEVSEETPAVVKKEGPEVRLSDGKFIEGIDGFQFNKKCKVQCKVKYLKETPRKRVVFELYSVFDNEEENLQHQVEGFEKDGIAEAEVTLFYGEKYKNALWNDPSLKSKYKFKAHHTNGEKVLESEMIEIPVDLKLLECSYVPGVTFELGKSFIRPTVAPHLKRLEDMIHRHPDGKIIIFGHTDKTGKDMPNKLLSERRAESVFAFITNNVDIWEKLYNEEEWGLQCVQTLLKDTGPDFDPGKADNVYGPKTKKALFNYQTERGLTVSEVNDKDTRAALFKEYMAGKHDIKLTPEQFMEPEFMGCGEFNPLINTEKANEMNRRVTFYLYPKTNLPKLPCKKGSIDPCKIEINKKNPRNRETFTCSFYDSIAKDCPCETPEKTVQFNLFLIDTEGNPLKEEDFILDFSGFRIANKTGPEGKVSEQIPENATSGTLLIRGWEAQISFKPLQPASTIEGAQTRLSNLGFYVKDSIDGASDDMFQRALQSFQNKHGLVITGALNPETIDKLVEQYGE